MSKKTVCWEEHISNAMSNWKEDYAACEGSPNFPVEEIRISPDKVDRDYFIDGAAKWLNTYYRNHRPEVKNLDKAYSKAALWLVDKTPSRVLQMNTREAFEVLCCKIWTVIITEEYGMF